MPYRYTMLMQVTTDPADRSSAQPHSGGWSESFWRQSLVPADSGAFLDLMTKRARMLPFQAALVGYRIATYTFTENHLIPGGASSGRVQMPGGAAESTDQPQAALMFSGTAPTGNSSRFTCKCIPDSVIVNGEYQPTASFKNKVTQFSNSIVDNDWCLLGRDLVQQNFRVLSITANVLTLNGNLVAADGISYIRFKGVRNTSGVPVSGSFLVSAQPGANQYTLVGLPQGTTVVNVGTARRDVIQLGNFSSVQPARIVVRKVGAPFEKYRGRSSRRARV